MATQEQILIIGAGALGLTSGYHLEMAGARITYLVREHRAQDLRRPQKLYCYNYHNLKTFENFEVLTDAAALIGQRFDFVLLTLDGAACRSDQGVHTLSTVGRVLAGSAAKLMINGVGIGLYEHVRKATGLPDSQLMQGTMGMYAYQVGRVGTPHPSNLNERLYAKADIAYLNFPNGVDFVVSGRTKLASRKFMELFNRCRSARCKVIPELMLTIFSNSFFPFTTACEINDWQGTETLIADRELWRLCCQSRREIMGLKRHGWVGRIFSFLMTDGRQIKMIRHAEAEAAPMGLTAFNKFHHGGKVQQQDIQIMENCLAAGESEGRDMSATRELLRRWRELQCGKKKMWVSEWDWQMNSSHWLTLGR